MLELIAPHVQGFSTSSLFEATVARDRLRTAGTVHLTTPGLRPDEIDRIARLCDYLSFNSLSQWSRYRNVVEGKLKAGLRVNPQISFLDDPRYDPCRGYSKLGAPIGVVREASKNGADLLRGISGLLVHNNCNALDFRELLLTVQKLEKPWT